MFRKIPQLFRTLFPALLITYLSLVLIEMLFEGSVISYLDLNLLLRMVVVVGIIAMLDATAEASSKKVGRLTAGNIFMITGAGVGGAAIVWHGIQGIGWLSYAISIVSGSLILLLLAYVWQGKEEVEIEEEDSQDN